MNGYAWQVDYNGETLTGYEVDCETVTGLFGQMYYPTVRTDDGRVFRGGYVWGDMCDVRVWQRVEHA